MYFQSFWSDLRDHSKIFSDPWGHSKRVKIQFMLQIHSNFTLNSLLIERTFSLVIFWEYRVAYGDLLSTVPEWRVHLWPPLNHRSRLRSCWRTGERPPRFFHWKPSRLVDFHISVNLSLSLLAYRLSAGGDHTDILAPFSGKWNTISQVPVN